MAHKNIIQRTSSRSQHAPLNFHSLRSMLFSKILPLQQGWPFTRL